MGIIFFIALRTNCYNRVSVQRPESKHDIISNEYYVLPKGDLFILKNEHLSKRLDDGRLNQCDCLLLFRLLFKYCISYYGNCFAACLWHSWIVWRS